MAAPFDGGRLVADLRAAVGECSSRGLIQAAKWQENMHNDNFLIPYCRFRAAEMVENATSDGQVAGPDAAAVAVTVDAAVLAEYDVLQFARTLFDTREFRRCAHALRQCRSPRALFLRCYASFLAYEKSAQEKLIPRAAHAPCGLSLMLKLIGSLSARVIPNVIGRY